MRRTLKYGTTSCVYFGSIHTDAAIQLGQTAATYGQRGTLRRNPNSQRRPQAPAECTEVCFSMSQGAARLCAWALTVCDPSPRAPAFVGKVNMDRNAPDSYCEETAHSIAETERFVEGMLSAAKAGGRDPAVPAPVPVITPRFVPTCTPELMHALGALAARHNLPIQSHVSENKNEIAWVRSLHPEEASYTAVYDAHGLLTERTFLAHGVYLEATEVSSRRSARTHRRRQGHLRARSHQPSAPLPNAASLSRSNLTIGSALCSAAVGRRSHIVPAATRCYGAGCSTYGSSSTMACA